MTTRPRVTSRFQEEATVRSTSRGKATDISPPREAATVPSPSRGEATDISTTPGRESGVVRESPPPEEELTHLVKVLGVDGFLTVCGGRDRKIAAIAQAQRGRVARRQLLAAGVTEGMIMRMLTNGWLHRLHQGVYAVGHLAPVDLGRETAALLTSRDGAVLSHLTAAAVWKLRPPTGTGAPVDITVAGSQAGSRTGVRIHRTRRLDPQEVRIHDGLPITSPARTLLDIAGLLNERELERALDEGLSSRIVRASEVADVIAGMGTRRGASLLAELLAHRRQSTVTRSVAEERFLALVRAAELPAPEVNVRLCGFEVDFLWRRQRIVVEVDGYRFHSSRSAFVRDRRKDATLKAAGWDPHRVTWDQMEEEPHAVVARLARTIATADPPP